MPERGIDVTGCGGRGNNHKREKESQENHNIEGAYSIRRETKDTHKHDLISEWRGGGKGGVDEDLKKKKKALGRQKGEKESFRHQISPRQHKTQEDTISLQSWT